MYIRHTQVLDTISDKVKDIELRVSEIKNLMPDDLSFKTLRQLAKEIVDIAKEIKHL